MRLLHSSPGTEHRAQSTAALLPANDLCNPQNSCSLSSPDWETPGLEGRTTHVFILKQSLSASLSVANIYEHLLCARQRAPSFGCIPKCHPHNSVEWLSCFTDELAEAERG